MSIEHVTDTLKQAQQALHNLLSNPIALSAIAKAGETIASCFKKQSRMFSCGNGGSMADAIHFAEELSGRYRDNRPAYAAAAISDPGHLSCVANDYGYEFVFSRYIEAHGRSGDGLLAISTSGKSGNIIKAAQAAKARGMFTIGLVGASGSPLGQIVDIEIATTGNSGYADRIQELHIKVIHILIELVERELNPENYRPQ